MAAMNSGPENAFPAADAGSAVAATAAVAIAAETAIFPICMASPSFVDRSVTAPAGAVVHEETVRTEGPRAAAGVRWSARSPGHRAPAGPDSRPSGSR
ncbi:hypothetical protein GCM10010278_82230 [Streptomyces melanogenes]|nr:hypothetical protein GCM10010278_82230 [Streptomyces melanogenes]